MGMWSEVRCPVCGQRGARKFLWMVKCPSRDCSKYDGDVAFEMAQKKATIEEADPRPLDGDFDPGPNRIEVKYRNYLDVERLFVGDRTTLRRRGNHLSLCLAPTGLRCSFERDRILNLQEVEAACPPETQLTGVERQILAYHSKHGTTSPRFEEIKKKLQ